MVRRLLLQASIACMCLVVLAVPARGGLLPFVIDPGAPDILGADGTISYDAVSHLLHAEAAPFTFTAPYVSGPFAFVDGGNTTVDLSVDNSGNFLSNGSGVKITGSVDVDGDGLYDLVGTNSMPLLQGNIFAFGADDPGPPTRSFDGYFVVTGGLLTQSITLTGGGTTPGGFTLGDSGGFDLVVEQQVSGILGDFSNGFSGTPVKPEFGRLASVPEPGSAIMALSGATVLVGATLARRSRTRNHGKS
jgi:hypothetical protein